MAVGRCRICSKMISISRISGGNKTALENPEMWAVDYQTCTYCNRMFCEKCVTIIEDVYDGEVKCPYCNSEVSEDFNPTADLNPLSLIIKDEPWMEDKLKAFIAEYKAKNSN